MAGGTRERLGVAHQLSVDVAIVLSLVPAWVRRALADRDETKARQARAEVVERVACAIERRFRVTWHGSDDADPNARAPDRAAPLFGGPDVSPTTLESQSGSPTTKDHVDEARSK